jgi:hypothetical protein
LLHNYRISPVKNIVDANIPQHLFSQQASGVCVSLALEVGGAAFD